MKFKDWVNESVKIKPNRRSFDLKSEIQKTVNKLGEGTYKFEADGFRSINNPKDYTFKGTIKVFKGYASEEGLSWVIKRGTKGYRVDGTNINTSAMKTNASSIVDIDEVRIG